MWLGMEAKITSRVWQWRAEGLLQLFEQGWRKGLISSFSTLQTRTRIVMKMSSSYFILMWQRQLSRCRDSIKDKA